MKAWLKTWAESRRPPPARKARRGATAEATHKLRYAANPLLASRTPPWRSKFLVGLLGAAFCVLVARAVDVQAVNAEFYKAQGASRYERKLDLPANRGRIFDRNGDLLASSVPVPSVWAHPKEFTATPEQKRQLAKLLGLSPRELDEKLASHPSFVWLRRQADDAVGEAVRKLGLKGVQLSYEYKRRYPEGEAAAHVVGFTNIEDEGIEGIERQFQRHLAGRDGERNVIRDRLGRAVEDVGDTIDAENGEDVTLSVDAKIQYFAFQKVRDAVQKNRAKAGSVVVLDVSTGEVLALANYPSYSPLNRANLTGEEMRNRALTDTFEPGSTMKPIVAAMALEDKHVTPLTPIDTAPGRIQVSGRTISDAHPHGRLTVEEVIQKSSNVGAVKLSQMLEAREMWETFSALGLGQKPQIEFPGAVTGRLRPYKTWRPVEKATMSYGYGLSASLFQLARAYTVFAHDGELLPASLLKVEQPPAGQRVFSTTTARQIRKMLGMVVSSEGTAPKAQTVGYSVGGKTGTAHKQEGNGYAARKYRAWFVGLAPVANPRIVVAVMVDEPSGGKYYGGDVAAPVFSDVVQQTLQKLGVTPDQDVTRQIVATGEGVEESF